MHGFHVCDGMRFPGMGAFAPRLLCKYAYEKSALLGVPSLLLFSLLTLLSGTVHAQSPWLWLGSGDALSQIDTENNQVNRTVYVGDTGKLQALCADPEGDVWAVGDKRLLKVAANGATLFEIEERSLGLGGPAFALLNPYDHSLWLVAGKYLLHLDANGQTIGKSVLPGVSRAAGLGLDENLWVLGNKELWQYSPQGKLVASHNLHTMVKEEPQHIAVDTLADGLWLAGERRLVRLDLNALDRPSWDVLLPKPAQALALDERNGIVWVLMNELLSAYRRDGTLVVAVNLVPLQVEKASVMVFDASSQSLWLGHKHGFSRFSATGELQATFASDVPGEKLGATSLVVTPRLTLVQPFEGDSTNDAQPEIKLGLDAFCFDVSCGFGAEHSKSFRIDALLDDSQIGSKFQFNMDTGQSIYTPVTRLADGLHNFKAHALDRFGHQSNRVSAAFTVDTIPPKFLAISPSDGSVFFEPQVTVSGKVDDAEAWVLLNGSTNSANTLNGNFSFPVLLEPGINTINLSAHDKAANSSSVDLHLSYVPDVSVTVSIDSPTAGATIQEDTVLVSGTFQGPSNTGITVNGIVASQNGNRYYASVPLMPGDNALTVTATRPEGITATQSVSVTSGGSSPISISVEPASGIAPLETTFSLQNNTANELSTIQIDFDGNGSVDFTTTNAGAKIETTYAAPGVYQARVTVTDSFSNVFAQTVLVSVQDGAQMDRMFETIFASMNAALIAGKKEQAMIYLNQQGQRKYGPVFDLLMPQMRSIVASYSPLQRLSVSETIGEYAVNRMIDGVNRIFFIYFLLDADGVWRLDSM